MLALGAHQGAVTGDKARLYMDVAINVTYTCHMMYNSTPTGGQFVPAPQHQTVLHIDLFCFRLIS